MLALAAAGADEGLWLRAERQTSGRGRHGREWLSPAGNLYASTLVRLHDGDPIAPTLAFVAAVALDEVVRGLLADSERQPLHRYDDGELQLKWPNDLLLAGAKLSGILLERAGDAVVIGIGVNLASHPDLPDRSTTSLLAHGVKVEPPVFLEALAPTFGRWLLQWRQEGLAPVRARWLERAHPIGTALSARLPDGGVLDGRFDGLDEDGALILRLGGGARRVIHAGDVFLL